MGGAHLRSEALGERVCAVQVGRERSLSAGGNQAAQGQAQRRINAAPILAATMAILAHSACPA